MQKFYIDLVSISSTFQRLGMFCNIVKHLGRTAQQTFSVLFMKTGQLELTAVCFEIHTKYVNTLVCAECRTFGRFRKFCETRLFPSSCLSVHPSVRMDQLGSHTSDSYVI